MNRPVQRIATLAAAVFTILLGNLASAEDFAAKWQEPVQITLPEPMRAFVLSSNIDPDQWLQTNNIAQSRLIRQGRQTLVQTPMSDADWASRKDQLCNAGGVLECDPGACQSIQLSAEAGNVANPDALQARILRKPPRAEQTVQQIDSGAGMCRMADPLPPLQDTASPAGQDIVLQVDLPSDPDAGSQAPASETPAADPAAADAAGQDTAQSNQPAEGSGADTDPYSSASENASAGQFKLQIEALAGQPQLLSTDQLPADTTGHMLMVGEGCQQQSVPLDSVAPAHVPGLIVAVTRTDASTVAGRWGLRVISESKLASSGDTVAVFFTDQALPLMLGQLLLDPDVIGAGREHIFTTTAGAGTPSYSDPFARFTYGPEQSGALALHSASTGEGETIAVIDTGVAHEHPDLAGRITYEDFTGKGWSADAHGTAVAGIIAAAADNASGTYGVAPAASILALKACHPVNPGGLQARCWTSSLIRALDAAMQADAQIINMSLAGPPDNLLARYVAQAVQQNRLIVAGAGNGGSAAKPAFPAALPGVLAVTAINRGERLYRDANQGAYIDLAAPGVDIVTISPDGSFPSSSGTSWAAAHVSGIAALMRPLMPLSSASEIAFYLSGASRDLGAPGKDDQFGNGIVDACAAARTATADAVSCGNQGDSSDGF